MASFDFSLWKILAILSGILLMAFWRSKNLVWGGFTLGLIIGIIIAIFKDGFDWYILAKVGIIGTLAGAFFELLGIIGELIKKDSQ